MASYFFLAMGCVTVIKALQLTFFLQKVGFDWRMPLLYVLSAALAAPVVLLYRILARQLSHLALSSGTLVFFILTLAGASHLLEEGNYWINFVFFVWAGLFALLLPTLGWVVCYDLFTAREGKRVFGLLGMGGILGGAAGASWTYIWTERVGTAGLLEQILAILLLLQLVFMIIGRSGRRKSRSRVPDSTASGPPTLPEDEPERIYSKGLLASPYLRSIAALVFISGLVTTMIDLQYLGLVRLTAPKDLPQLISVVFGSSFLVSGMFQLVATGRLLNRFGIPAALMVLPTSLVGGSAIGVASPGLVPAVSLRAIDGFLRPSLHRTAVEVLYVPVAGQGAVSVKSLVDLLIFRLGDASGALVFLFGLAAVSSSFRLIPVLILFGALAWAFLAWRTSRAYIENLRSSVHQAARSRRRLHLHDFRSADLVMEQLRETDGWRLRIALDQLASFSETGRRSPALRPVGAEEMLESHISGLYTALPPWFPMVSNLVSHPDPETGAAAFHLLVRYDPKSYLRKLKKELQRDEPPATVYLVYLATYGDQPERVVDSAKVLKWSREVRGIQGAALARIMGRTGDTAYLPVLSEWLHSPDPELQKGAVEAIGHFGDQRFWDTLVSFLHAGRTRQAARIGLANYGTDAVDRLMALLRNPDVDLAVKREVPLILGQIRTSAARAALMVALFWPDPVVSFRALKVLNKTRAYRELSYVQASFVPVLMQWAREYYQARNLESVVPPDFDSRREAPARPPRNVRAWRLLLKVVKERESWSVEKIFRTLDLFLPRGEGYLSYLAMDDRTMIRDNAIELIDLRLKGEAKQVLIPIFGERDRKEQVKIGRRLFGLPAEKEAVIREALFDADPLVRSSVLAVVGEERLSGLLEDVQKAGQDPNKMVRETAELVLHNWNRTGG
ncbi:MAG: HEAT repeat domain-containing protein [Acidobacteriota bacterium]